MLTQAAESFTKLFVVVPGAHVFRVHVPSCFLLATNGIPFLEKQAVEATAKPHGGHFEKGP